MNQEQNELKGALIEKLGRLYRNLTQYVKQLPIGEELRKHAIMNLDQGVMWVEHGIKHITFNVPKGAQENDEEKSPSEKESGQEACKESGKENGQEEVGCQVTQDHCVENVS